MSSEKTVDEWWNNDNNSEDSDFDISPIKPKNQNPKTERESPYVYSISTIKNQFVINSFSHSHIKQFMNLFHILNKIEIYCILPFQETRSFYNLKYVSEKLPLMMLSTLTKSHPWFFNPFELAEDLTLAMKDRVNLASKNMELLFFKSERMLEMELFTPLRDEFVQNDFEKLAIIDSYKVLTYLYLNSFLINTCFLCKKSPKTQDSSAEKCKGTCQFDVKSENDESGLLKYLFQFEDPEEKKKLKLFGKKNKVKLSASIDWKSIKLECSKKIQKVIKHKNFIPKKKSSRLVEIVETKD
jgi:hypothetical protein